MQLIKNLLDEAAARIETPEFIADDPVQFPRLFSSLPDIEITALCTALMAWGNRRMILRDARRLLEIMDMQPHRWVKESGWRDLDPALNLHRTLFVRDLSRLLEALRKIYSRYPTLEAFMEAEGVSRCEAPAWEFAARLQQIMLADGEGACPQCIPSRMGTTPLKRFNMAFRWLVRRDSPVDLGVWRSISPSQLYIPLDVHVGRISRETGLLLRRSNDRKAVEELTGRLRELLPEDPTRYDFALFGLGIERKESALKRE